MLAKDLIIGNEDSETTFLMNKNHFFTFHTLLKHIVERDWQSEYA